MERTKFGGSNAKRFRMKCRDCFNRYKRAWRKGNTDYCCSGRFTLRKHPDKYVLQRYKNCPCCGSSNVMIVEHQRRRETAKQNTCYCHHIPFPHKKGELLGCEHHPKDYDDWTEEDHQQFQDMLATPRSG